MNWKHSPARLGLTLVIGTLLIAPNLACSPAEPAPDNPVEPAATPLPTFTPALPPTPAALEPLPSPAPAYEVIEAAAADPAALGAAPPPPPLPAPPELPPITDFETVSLVRFIDADTVEVLVDGVPYQLPYVTLPPAPTPIPRPAVPAVAQWDARLDALGVKVNRAQVVAGQPVFRLVSALYRDETESGGLHHIYVEVLDEHGQRIVGQPLIQAWRDGQVTFYTEKKYAPEYGANVPIYGVQGEDNYRVYVEDAASDVVEGLGLPGGQLVSYLLT
ncbi:MAG: hypothetical protein AB1801_06785, partial [Chloroflexota bacterium]